MSETVSLEELAQRCRERAERGETLSLADMGTDDPARLEELRLRIQAVASMMSLLGMQESSRTTSTDGGGPSTPKRATVLPEIPGYEILGQLGRGGMGIVFRARQRSLNRMVALKMILSGAGAANLDMTRFAMEAEAVARLQHPNIVQIFEFGEHQGQPFFSLELVGGGSLDQKLSGTPLPHRLAAEMVEAIARAAQYAHQCNIVHRDLKPSNILLTAEGTPKITDFGLAKHLDCDTGQTRSGSVLGTPSYMAPEQASGNVKEIGPVSDVYSLGAVLYECLTGRPPFKGASILDTLGQVRNVEPVPPSRLQPGVPRDLEIICLKCLHKDPKRRYASAQALADDLRRFLQGKPIEARPVGRAEIIARWCRRNPVAAASLFATLAVLVVAFLAITFLWRDAVSKRNQATNSAAEASLRREEAQQQTIAANAARSRAEAETAKALAVSQFLAGLFEESDPFRLTDSSTMLPRMASTKLTARDLLDRGAERLQKDHSLTPETRALIQDRIGSAYVVLGEEKKAKPLLEAALAIRRGQGNSADLAVTLHTYAWLQQCLGNFDLAERTFHEVLQLRENDPAVGEAERIRTLFHLGWLLAEKEEPLEAERLFRQVLDRRIQLYGDTHRDVAVAHFALAAVLLQRSKYVEGAGETAKALAILKKLPEEADLAKVMGLFQESVVFSGSGAYTLAERKILEAIAALRQTVSESHGYLGLFYGQLADIRRKAGKLEQAEEAIRQCFAIVEANQALYHPMVRRAVVVYTQIMNAQNKGELADELFEKMIRAQEEHFGKRHPFVADTLTTYANWRGTAHGPEWKSAKLNEALAIYRSGPETTRTWFLTCLRLLGRSLIMKDDPQAAEPLLRQCLRLTQRHYDDNPQECAPVKDLLAAALLHQGKADDEVEQLLNDARKVATPLLGSAPVDRSAVLFHLGEMYLLRKQPESAMAALRESRSSMRNAPDNLIEVAREFMHCASLPGQTTRQTCEREALATLQLAVKQKFSTWTMLRTDPIFEPLRNRQEFRDLLPKDAP